jgi:hypothetical protein
MTTRRDVLQIAACAAAGAALPPVLGAGQKPKTVLAGR